MNKLFTVQYHSVIHFRNNYRMNIFHNIEQAGTGPSRRHIQGSKIAKDFQVSSIRLQ